MTARRSRPTTAQARRQRLAPCGSFGQFMIFVVVLIALGYAPLAVAALAASGGR